MLRKALVVAAVLAVAVSPAFAAMTVREFRKFPEDQQFVYIGAAVSMLAYTYAADGKPAKGRCIQNWYYGEPGKESSGPKAIALELAVAAQRDPDKYTVEGIILGLTDKVCGSSPPPPSR